jgi:putative ABC transport system permease protein
MIINYLKSTIRNLWYNKFYSGLNITGLAIGLAVGIMILMWVEDEYSFDRFHNNATHIYTVISNVNFGGNPQSYDAVPAPIGSYSLRALPEVKNAVRIADNYDLTLFTYGDKQFTQRKSAFVDPSVFSVFDFKLLHGNTKRPFSNDNSVILSESMAIKFFGQENPIGKVIRANNEMNFTVEGIMKDFPGNSSLQYDMFFPISILVHTYEPGSAWKSLDADWGNYGFFTYLLLRDGADIEAVGKKLTMEQRKQNPFEKSSFYTLQPFTHKHLYAADGSNGPLQAVRIFLLISVLILLIACINYVNLSTARSIIRSKEVSIRKIIGAARMQIFFQFIFETFILFILASIVALLLIFLLLPLYNQISGKNLQPDISEIHFWLPILFTIAAALILSSVYPALLLSSFRPISALKGKLSFGTGNVIFRKILVTIQFVFSAGLIIATIVIGKQLKYISQKELGYDKEHVLSFDMLKIGEHYDAVKTELLNQPGILGVTSSSQDIINSSVVTGDVYWEGKQEGHLFLIHPIGIDKDFARFFKLNIISGQQYTGAISDSTGFILNETAVRKIGIHDPVGKKFSLWHRDGIISGIVKDFHFASLKQKIEPAVFYYSPANATMPSVNRMYVKTTGAGTARAIASTSRLWKTFNPGFPFQYEFLDESYNSLYKEDQRTGLLFSIFTIVAIMISCLGLLGLSTYTAQVKVKEIGIRKILGASVWDIARLMGRDFARLIIIALLIASPIAWYMMNQWLKDFAYRITVGWSIFLFSAIITLVMVLITISFQAIRAATANPVKNLRTE